MKDEDLKIRSKAPGSFSPTGYKECRWCGDLVNSEKCFGLYTGVSVICEICGKDVTGWETS